MTTNDIIPISKVNNSYLQVAIDFLEPFADPTCEGYEIHSGPLLTLPQQILNGFDVAEMRGYIAGRITARIESIRNSLIEINAGELKMNSLGAEVFKQLYEDVKEGRSYLTMSIPFTTETYTFNFIKLTGATKWSLINFWSNEVNLLQCALVGYMQHKEVTSSELFRTEVNTSQTMTNDISNIVDFINSGVTSTPTASRIAAITEYLDIFYRHPVGNADQDFPVEVMYDVGLLGNGLTLPVKLKCKHPDHPKSNDPVKVLPYTMKDGSPNMLLCWECSAMENTAMLLRHPEYATND